jgi:hypothetical protein
MLRATIFYYNNDDTYDMKILAFPFIWIDTQLFIYILKEGKKKNHAEGERNKCIDHIISIISKEALC